jgi:pimeloyl-ACP methyl ester carboxylesterase
MRDDVTEEQLAAFARQVALAPPGVEPSTIPGWPVWVRYRRSLRGGMALFRHVDSLARVRALDVPVLLVKGTDSAHFLHRIVDGLAAELPRAEVAEWSGGHSAHLANPEAFLARLQAFAPSLREPPSSTSATSVAED